MLPSIEDDLFYDLFGDEGFLSPESTGSTSQDDSGLGSPFESTSDNSPPPLELAWDTDDHLGEFWGSILDDLPSDITDGNDSNNEQQALLEDLFNLQSNTGDNNYNEALLWSTKVLEEGTVFDYNSTAMKLDETWTSEESVFDDTIKEEQVVSKNNYTDIINKTFPTTPIGTPVTDVTSSQSQYNQASENNEIEIQSTTPTMITNPVSARNTPTWIVKTCNTKPRFRIGPNLIATLQNDDNMDTDDKRITGLNSICGTLFRRIKTSEKVIRTDEGSIENNNHSDHDYADKDLPDMSHTTTGVSQGMGPGLILTDEETKLLEKECLNFPEGAFLTKEEQKALKRVRRKIKNKQSAMESRRKRKVYIENLEHRLMQCTDLSNGLKKKVEKLNKENKSLVNQMKVMKGFIGATYKQTRTNGNGTCLAVLLLSFSLCILPFSPLQFFEGKSEQAPAGSVSASPATKFRSRTLMSFDESKAYISQDKDFFDSMSYEHYYYYYEPPDENGKVHFENNATEIDYRLEANFTMYMHQNFTWNSPLNNVRTERQRKLLPLTSSHSARSTPINSGTLRPTPCHNDQYRRTSAPPVNREIYLNYSAKRRSAY